MLFKISSAFVLGLLSIATVSASKVALEPREWTGVGSTGVVIHPRDHENYTAGFGFTLEYQGFLRVTLQTALIDVALVTANGLNKIVVSLSSSPPP